MKQQLDILTKREVPEHLDVSILAAAKFSAYRKNKHQRAKRLLFAASGMVAAVAAGFAIFITLPSTDTACTEAQYYSLNDLSTIEQETFALASELNCRSIYALDNSITLEN